MGGLRKEGHLVEDCPTDANAAKVWLEDDKMFPKIVNCISRKVILCMQHCKTVKELWTLLHKWFSGASNLNRLYNLTGGSRPIQKRRSIMDTIMTSCV